MPPTSFDRDSGSDYATAADVESSDAASTDESGVLSHSGRKKKGHLPTTSSAPRGKSDLQRVLESPNPSPSPSRAVEKSRQDAKEFSPNLAGNVGVSSNISRISSTPSKATTPSKGTPLRSTPSRRTEAIEGAFKKLAIEGSSPTVTPTQAGNKLQATSNRRVIVIDDSDEEEVMTDVEVTMPPTRPSSFYERPPAITTDSSQSSMNSIFSRVAETSSSSSLEASFAESGKSSVQIPRPIHVEDLFNSPNVTRRKPQKLDSICQVPPLPQPALSSTRVPESISRFARSSFGVELDQALIAHCDETQKLMDDNLIAWGTQFELARGVSNGSWSWPEIRQHLHELKGKNVDSAFKVQQVMRSRSIGPIQPSDLHLWKELDREQAAIMENQSRGLGLMGEWEGVQNWYGGQIQQPARLAKDGDSYKIILEPMEKRRSHRFARFYGSRRFLQLRIPDVILRKENSQVKSFLKKEFILCGRTFVPFHSKEHGLYMVETKDNCGRSSQDWCGDQFRLSFQEFINWHNPLEEAKNYSQVLSKYATRFALGLSNSVPALQFDEKDIMFIDDMTASDWPEGKKNPPANKLMTDGCGFLNHAALHRIVKYLGYESLPAGVQGRIDGSKGFWILHPSDDSPIPKIWIRNSQNKIKNTSFDRAHTIFDLLCPSRPSPPIALTQQSIINVFANGIPSQILIRLMEEGLENEVAPLLNWNRSNAMVFLWDAVNKAGNVSGARTQRLAASLNRALGLKGRDWGRDDGTDPDNIDSEADGDGASLTYTGRNKYSGAPLALHEYAMELIQAGFHPERNKLLNDKIGWVIRNVITSSVDKYRIPIQESLGAFVVPDPLGVLKEGEIYYRFSRPRKDPKTEMLIHVLEGEVIVGRYPIRLPSDMQRVRAVDRRELDRWPDVIIISTQGKRSLASLLADGDMDGDELIVIWDREIVELFDSKPFTDAPSDLIESNFEPSGKVETVEKFCVRTETLSQQQISEAFLDHLISNLNESQVGLYSMMHENATVAYGYDHPHSVRLAYIFATLLDSSKTGHRLKANIRELDLKKFGNSSLEPISELDSLPPSKDILSLLKMAASRKGDELISRHKAKELANLNDNSKDKDLLQPYSRAIALAFQAYEHHKITAFTDELSAMRKHVDVAFLLFQAACGNYRAKKNQESPSKGGKSFQVKSDQEDLMLACTKAYAKSLEGVFLTHDLEQVKASYAYTLCRSSESFAFSVAFQELCHIKAVASGGLAPTLRIFDEAKSISGSHLKALKCCDEDLPS